MKKLNSVFKDVPLQLMDELAKYRTKGSTKGVRWKMRKPVPGQKYGYGGTLKREHATAADMYVDFDQSTYHDGFRDGRSQIQSQEKEYLERIAQLEGYIKTLEDRQRNRTEMLRLLKQEMKGL